jgi:hypothetical protein
MPQRCRARAPAAQDASTPPRTNASTPPRRTRAPRRAGRRAPGGDVRPFKSIVGRRGFREPRPPCERRPRTSRGLSDARADVFGVLELRCSHRSRGFLPPDSIRQTTEAAVRGRSALRETPRTAPSRMSAFSSRGEWDGCVERPTAQQSLGIHADVADDADSVRPALDWAHKLVRWPGWPWSTGLPWSTGRGARALQSANP